MPERLSGTVLYGMMGAGKTTLGQGLAEHLGQRFVDTDQLIERRFGMSCGQIVSHPEMNFNNCQRATIEDYKPSQAEVVATGGSVAMDEVSVRRLAHLGIGVFIKVSAEALQERLPAERIADLNNPDGLSFAELYAARIPFYAAAADEILEVADDETPEITIANLIDMRAAIDARQVDVQAV